MKVINHYDPVKLKQRDNPIFLVDFSWLLCNSYYAYRKNPRYMVENRYVGDIISFIERITHLMSCYPDSLLIFCLDGSNLLRKDIYPEYKAGRYHSDDLWDNYEEIMQIIAGLDKVLFAYDNQWEADDVMYTLIQEYKSYSSPLYLYTSDQDMDPYLNNNIQTGIVKFTSIKNGNIVPITYNDQQKKHGYDPRYMVKIKILCGDSHNNVKGFKYFRKKQAQQIVECGKEANISLLQMMDGTFPEKMPANLIKICKSRIQKHGAKECKEMIALNSQIIPLHRISNLNLIQLQGSFEPFNELLTILNSE